MLKVPTKKMKNRLMRVVATFLVLGFVFVIFNVGKVSLVESDKFKALAASQQLDDMIINPKRGVIYDRNMTILAQSATVWTVYISPAEIEADKKDALVSALSEMLEIDKAEIEAKANKKNKYQEVKKKVEKPLKDQIETYMTENKIKGVYYGEDSKRYYPYNNLASSVIGFTGVDNTGFYGIEAKYDKYLAGTPGRTVRATNAKGIDMPFKYEKLYDPVDGNGVVLSLDETIQHFLEKALEDVLIRHKVKNGVAGIVMDVNTGEILAMSTKPDFDLNQPWEISSDTAKAYIEALSEDKKSEETKKARETQWRNKGITEIYEPGSVFKVVTGSAALEEQAINLNSTFSCPGFQIVAGQRIRCHKAGGHGALDFTGAVVNSCNPAFMQIGAALGKTNFFNYFKAYGLTEKTGIDLPGEAQSLFYKENEYGPVELASCSFGQSNAITPIQMITAFSAVVNGGYLLEPYVVKQVIDNNNATILANTRTVKRQVVSEETSAKMRIALEKVVSANGGGNAYVKGFSIGGKSGTSEKLSAEDKSDRIGSFIGFAPVENPQIAVLVMADVPSNGQVYGSVVAAPAVADVLADTLPYIGIAQQFTEEELKNFDTTIPNLNGLTVGEAKSKLLGKGLKIDIVGTGDTVLNQFPLSGTPAPKNGKIVVYTNSGTTSQMVKVPNVIGLSPQNANQTLSSAGLNVRFKKELSTDVSSKISVQSIPEGQEVQRGTIIEIDFVNVIVDG